MSATFKRIFLNENVVWFKFHWRLFPRAQLTNYVTIGSVGGLAANRWFPRDQPTVSFDVRAVYDINNGNQQGHDTVWKILISNISVVAQNPLQVTH